MRLPPAKTCPSCGERYDPDVLFCPRDGTPLANSRKQPLPETDDYLGTELAGNIRLKHLIGIGSMGRVYLAWQAGIERHVAVKVLHRELSGNPELVSRFHREAKVASRLVHPNVVQVLMTGTVPKSGDPRIGGELYLVMEHLDGISLLSALAAAGTGGEGQALPLPRALHVALQICDAVGEAHAQQIVHRDLKPENVMLVKRGDDPDFVKLLDFGIARLDWADKAMETQAGLIFGTAKYISPEGAEGHPVGPGADVYAIATMLYQMLAGRTPFEGDSHVALLVQHSHAPPTDLREIARASYVPGPIAALIMQNLAKRPGDRASNGRVLGRELVAAARASGLYPEEIASQSTLFSPNGFGAVKLVSKERTKALELSVDLARKIGGVPALQRDVAGEAHGARSDTPPPASARSRARSGPPSNGRNRRASEPASTLEMEPAPRSRPSSVPRASARPRVSSHDRFDSDEPPARPELDFDDAQQPSDAPPAAPEPTIQGTETSLDRGAPRSARVRRTRILALVACLVVAVPLIVLGSRRLVSSSSAGDTADATIDEARECMRRHAWDSPPQHNVKELTDAALAKWPADPRAKQLRREAAEMLVSDALGRKYASDVPEATRLAKLALEFNPQHTTAQHLVADLETRKAAPDVEPAGPSPPPSADKPPPKSSRPGRSAPREARPPAPPPQPKGAVLPKEAPPPPPPPTSDKPAAPAGTGPWL